MSPAEVVRAAFDALRCQDLEAFEELLHPAVEVEGLKGDFAGIDEVRRWATSVRTGELAMRVELDRIVEVGDSEVAVGARRQWRWREDDALAEESEFGVLVTFRDGLIYRWRQRFDDLQQAMGAAAEPEPEASA